ncbi:MAG: fumarylacetoacetate hydrolase family protein [Defluviicoccus sp.]|nr:fumarylacetoacetate hydrolase family protein [Defluviicoccus sp.]MDE0384495.1 fumarylacetoacetate hydrolase family protein [Defluviicoccus sp.]
MNSEEAAALLGRARQTVAAVGPLPEPLRPVDEAEAYRVQQALRAWFADNGDPPQAGYKLGCTTPVMQAMLGLDAPVHGGVRAGDVHPTGAVLPAAGFRAPGIECEIALRLGCDIDARRRTPPRARIAGAVAEAMPAIEIVDNRYGDWSALGTPTLIADDFFQAACVLGKPADCDPMALDRASGRTLIDGIETGRGKGTDVLGHPLDALAWLARALGRRGAVLRAGTLVMTGSLVRTAWLERFPAAARVEIDGVGAAEVRLE